MEVETLLQMIVDEVKSVEGIRAVVLGGSRARGTHKPSSDIDLGIYYHPNRPLDLNELSRVAANLDDAHRAELITPIGGWGPWINGGGWLKIHSSPVDFLYRDLEKVMRIMDECLNGKVEIFYQPGHPYGFISSIYLAEVAICLPLWDPEGIVVEFKKKTNPYPDALQKALVRNFAWEIDFSIGIARKSVERSDVAYAAGCCFRSVMCMLQVLFALNQTYWLNEKGAVALANSFVLKPTELQSRIENAFHLLDTDPHSIQKAIDNLEELSQDIHVLIPDL